MTGDLNAAPVSFLSARPPALARLRALHVDDTTGHYRAYTLCGQAGHQI